LQTFPEFAWELAIKPLGWPPCCVLGPSDAAVAIQAADHDDGDEMLIRRLPSK